jgi:histone acetyltransferase (RNA polymerase elongator complex component)
MTVDEEIFKRMTAAYDQIVSALDANKLDKDESFSLLAQMVCQLSNDDRNHFMWQMSRFYSMERFLRPESKEIH